MYKRCSKCNIKKELRCFGNDKNRKDGKYVWCRDCKSIHVRKRYVFYSGRTEEQVRKNNIHEYSGKIVDGMKTCSDCNEWKTVDNFSKVYLTKCGLSHSCKKCNLWRIKIINRILKMEFVLAYGGCCQCSGCGERRLNFLTVEHIRDGKHKLIYDYATQLIRKLKALGWPKNAYKCLCWNCNLSTKYNTPCMHSNEYKDYETRLEASIKSDKTRDKYFKLKQQLN